ncbi:MAG: hypothetical protein R3B70_24395 [Polyangiaceae bacterium]
MRDAASALLYAVLPAAGARAPSTSGVAWEVAVPEGEHLCLEAQIDAPPPALPNRLVQASETLHLAADADSAAYRGDAAEARDAYLTALERAPRHPEISERLAWLDAVAGERPEAALSTLIDVTPAVDAGLLGAELLAGVNDADGARAALTRAARSEPFAPLAARTWLRRAAVADSVRDRLASLDEAIVRAPAFAAARWSRLQARLTAADPNGALADAQHLEAAARGARLRHEIARRAARAFLAAGFVQESHRLFERALRYVPDDPEAVAGLARALAAQGLARRALDLFARALGLAERTGSPTSSVAIDLAKALVDVAADRPAAIARVRSIPAGAAEAPEARLLEARWRAELGDVAGAGLAIGRLRDHAERDPLTGAAAPAPGTEASLRAEALAALLTEAASIDERARDDLAGAQRDLALALRLAPRDTRISNAFRRVAREHARRAGGAPLAAGAPAMPAPPRRTAAAVRGRPGATSDPTALPDAPPPPFEPASPARAPHAHLGTKLPAPHGVVRSTNEPTAQEHAPTAQEHAPTAQEHAPQARAPHAHLGPGLEGHAPGPYELGEAPLTEDTVAVEEQATHADHASISGVASHRDLAVNSGVAKAGTITTRRDVGSREPPGMAPQAEPLAPSYRRIELDEQAHASRPRHRGSYPSRDERPTLDSYLSPDERPTPSSSRRSRGQQRTHRARSRSGTRRTRSRRGARTTSSRRTRRSRRPTSRSRSTSPSACAATRATAPSSSRCAMCSSASTATWSSSRSFRRASTKGTPRSAHRSRRVAAPCSRASPPAPAPRATPPKRSCTS